MLRRRGLQPRKSLFAKQPSEDTGGVSDLPPRRRGGWAIYGISRVVLGMGRSDWRQGKCGVTGVLSRCICITCFCIFKMEGLAWSEGGVFQCSNVKSYSSDVYTGPVLGSVVPTSPSRFAQARSWHPSSCKTTGLREAGKVIYKPSSFFNNLFPYLLFKNRY